MAVDKSKGELTLNKMSPLLMNPVLWNEPFLLQACRKMAYEKLANINSQKPNRQQRHSKMSPLVSSEPIHHDIAGFEMTNIKGKKRRYPVARSIRCSIILSNAIENARMMMESIQMEMMQQAEDSSDEEEEPLCDEHIENLEESSPDSPSLASITEEDMEELVRKMAALTLHSSDEQQQHVWLSSKQH